MRFVGRGESTRAGLPHRVLLAVIALAAVAVALSACGSGDDDGGSGDEQGVIEITCGTVCLRSPSDNGANGTTAMVTDFNEKYRGRYHIKGFADPKMRGSNERGAYYQRLALADDLPDLFNTTQSEAALLGRTGKVMDFAPFLKEDSDWASMFQEGVLAANTDEAGHIWGMPLDRNAIGIYYNKAIFKEAGVSEFPTTWDELNVACEKIKAIGKTCMGMDGLWTTLLMWANLIGTQPGGADFLAKDIQTDDFSTFPEVVRATETLKQWHVDGFTNRDAFSGEYQGVANAFVRGQVAMIANGPWMVNTDIKTKNAIKGLYDNVGYEVSPGWTADDRGVVVVAGESGLSSGAKDERKQEAVLAFMKFAAEPAQAYTWVKVTSSYPSVNFVPTAAERKTLEPLGLALNARSTELSSTYVHAFSRAPPSLVTVFPNLWPAYVKGQMSTQEFLSKFAADMQSKTG